ncbi:alkene reductase [Amycolatopsis sp. WQ 127309]|uniref:alkene reductase n=1 Tax=Amycolatopsis sp. WQ 127309 TaxID=2932773 RepID=UPI001FF4C4C1|nr:alkene reductase [Amycolatopsis sp. WQ 127309]UOZ03439.1 alkene reductase [Amycolatopsis sp. WQ 127309]
MPTAFDPIELLGHRLASRIVMAPMSRARAAGPEACPGPSTVTYYRQRASAGLIISEAIFPSPESRGQPATPGIYTKQQTAAWRRVTDAVHTEGGVIVGQLMHTGRIGHPLFLADGRPPLAPSAVRADHQVFTPEGIRPCVQPREMSSADIARTVAHYSAAASNLVEAGFDGVEIHAANGFLAHQFLSSAVNRRTDEWGGDVARRIRFVVELAEAVGAVAGADRVGVQISPGNPFNDMADPEADELYPALVAELKRIGLAYLEVSEAPDTDLVARLRKQWEGVFILNPRTAPRPTGLEDLALVEQGATDMISYGALFLANPDLPTRLAAGGPFNTPKPEAFYGGGDEGYIDYPTLED